MRRIILGNKIATNRQSLASQRGSILPYLSVAVGIVTLIALTLMTGLGDVILHRRDASNAADAAALAAAEAWANSIETTYGNATNKSSSEDEFWGNAGKGVGSFAGPTTKQAAEHYAKLNGATVTSYSVDNSRGTVTVSVRTNSTITHTNRRTTASSTAKVVFENGVCLTGGKVGFEVSGKCMTHSDSSESTPKQPTPPPPTATATATPTQFKPPIELSKTARVTAKLI